MSSSHYYNYIFKIETGGFSLQKFVFLLQMQARAGRGCMGGAVWGQQAMAIQNQFQWPAGRLLIADSYYKSKYERSLETITTDFQAELKIIEIQNTRDLRAIHAFIMISSVEEAEEVKPNAMRVNGGIGDLQGLEFVCEHEGYRYYKNTETGKQCALDSVGYWYVFDEKSSAFVPLNTEQSDKQSTQRTEIDDKPDQKLKNVQRFGIKFDHNGRPIFPKNEKGQFVLPTDEKGLPFFPVDDRGKPIFPYDSTKGEPTFPVDDTEEPIFPRNDQNKPIVPSDKNGQPIFPMDANGSFIFPLDENNCPIPALKTNGTPVIPKDAYGNYVIPNDRDGKPLIHIASDGQTPISIAEWKMWKKYYKEQARNFYQQQQQQQQPVQEATADHQINSMFHPLNLERQNVSFAADMEMLQVTRRVRPEDVNLPNVQMEQQAGVGTEQAVSSAVTENGTMAAALDAKQLKRKKFLESQLKSVKKVILPPQVKKEEPKKKEELENEKSRKKKEIGKRNEQIVERKIERNRRRRRRSSSRSSSSSRSIKRRASKRSRKARSPSYSSSYNSSSSNSTYSSRSRTRSPTPSFRENRRKEREEEEEIRERILARTLAASEISAAERQLQEPEQIEPEPEEYGPKPPAQLEMDQLNTSDMEMSEEEPEIIEEQPRKKENKPAEAKSSEVRTEHQENHLNDSRPEESKEMLTTANLMSGPFNVKEILKSTDPELIRQCKEQEREKFEQLKLQIVELEVEKSIHKRNWTQLREVERKLERKTGKTEYLSSSEES